MKVLKQFLAIVLLSLPLIVNAADAIDINTAGKQQLMQMQGVGEARAEAIIEYRKQNGGFDSVDELSEVSGIGSATLNNNRDMLTVSKAD